MFRKRFIALVMALTMLFTLMAPALTFATGAGSEEETTGTGTSEVTEETNEQGSDTDPDEGDGAGNDAGDTNTGADNTGDTGTGDAGADNTGDTGTGDSDTGTGDTGTGDTGTGDTGTGNAGTGDTGTGNAGTGDTGTSDTGTGDTGTDETLPPATVPGEGDGDGDGEGDGDGDADKGGDQLPSDGEGEGEPLRNGSTRGDITIKVGVVRYLDGAGSSGWQVHYWGGKDGAQDANCTLTNGVIVKYKANDGWSDARPYYVYTATIPNDATGYKVRHGDTWFGADGSIQNPAVYVYNYGNNNHADYVSSIEAPGTITVYFAAPQAWNNTVMVHYWYTDDNVDFGGTVMPGETMTHVQGDKFAATIPANVNGLLFREPDSRYQGRYCKWRLLAS